MMNVLITGVGGPVGQAILKALRLSSLDHRVVVADRDPSAVGLFWVETSQVLPDATSPEYVDRLADLCASERTDIVLLGSEGELITLAPMREWFEQELHTQVIVSPLEVLDITLNKWETYRFFKQHNLPYPRTALGTSSEQVKLLVEEVGFPLIVKPSRGSGSRNVYRVTSERELDFFRSYVPRAIVQEYLAAEDAEYTVGVFVSKEGEPLGSVALRRQLAAGLTYRAEVVQDQTIAAVATRVARALKPLGPCNLQLRLTDKGPIVFEVNPRFSTSTGMRANFGFNEVEFTLRHFLLNEQVCPPSDLRGCALRYWEEFYPEAALLAPAGQVKS
jgi:carbamoyl-phosphate synthase large subunit